MKQLIDVGACSPLSANRKATLYKLFWSCLAVLPLTMGTGFHRLHPRNPQKAKPILTGTAVPADVMQVLQQSCRDCHSDNTVWPWYSHVAPLSWMIEGDVQKGRSAMNLSKWAAYTTIERQAFLREIVPMVQSRMMPLPKYTVIHRDARLSDHAIGVLSSWAAAERHRLRTQQQFTPIEDDPMDPGAGSSGR